MMRKAARTVMVLLTIGTFVSAGQVSSNATGKGAAEESGIGTVESVFTAAEGTLDLQDMASSFRIAPEAGMRFARGDTLETYDIRLEEEKGSGINAKTIAALIVIGVFAGVALWVLIGEDDEAPVENGGGKPLPDNRGIAVPIP